MVISIELHPWSRECSFGCQWGANAQSQKLGAGIFVKQGDGLVLKPEFEIEAITGVLFKKLPG